MLNASHRGEAGKVSRAEITPSITELHVVKSAWKNVEWKLVTY